MDGEIANQKRREHFMALRHGDCPSWLLALEALDLLLLRSTLGRDNVKLQGSRAMELSSAVGMRIADLEEASTSNLSTCMIEVGKC